MYRSTRTDEFIVISRKTMAFKLITASLAAMFLLLPAVAQAAPPGLTSKRYRISSRRFKSKSFAKRVVSRLKSRFGIGRLRTKADANGTLKISFKNYAAKARQSLSRKANRNIRNKGLKKNTYYLKYSVGVSGVTVTKQLKIKASG